jgi:hypothetical protein
MMNRLVIVILAYVGLSEVGFAQNLALVQDSNSHEAVCQGSALKCAMQGNQPGANKQYSGFQLASLRKRYAVACGTKGNHKPWGTVCSSIGKCNSNGVCCGVDDIRCLGRPPQ